MRVSLMVGFVGLTRMPVGTEVHTDAEGRVRPCSRQAERRQEFDEDFEATGRGPDLGLSIEWL
jgi:hypothetical protein